MSPVAVKAEALGLGPIIGRQHPRERGGSFGRYETADVYHHPDLGTFAIPDPVRGEWGRYGYEMHWLGYPVAELDQASGTQRFEHGWVAVTNGVAFAMWVDPSRFGLATAAATGFSSGWIVQLTTAGKVARSPEGEITVLEPHELAPPEAEYLSRPRRYMTLAELEESLNSPPRPEVIEPEFPDGLDYDPDDIPEY